MGERGEECGVVPGPGGLNERVEGNLKESPGRKGRVKKVEE